MGRVIREISETDPFPSALDTQMMMPPVARCWFRRVQNENPWLVFVIDDTAVTILRVKIDPPGVPIRIEDLVNEPDDDTPM